MSFSTIGDLRQQLHLSQTSTRLKSDLDVLVKELTTGKKLDLTAHLGAKQTNLISIDRRLGLIDGFIGANSETNLTLQNMQLSLNAVNEQREIAGGALLLVTSASSPDQLKRTSETARNGFIATVQNMNLRINDRSLFGGNDLTSAPLANADDMLSAVRSTLLGISSAAAISSAIDVWFDSAGGGFESDGYKGDSAGLQKRPVDTNIEAELNFRADDIAIRNVLKGLAKGIFATDPSINISQSEGQELQKIAGIELTAASKSVAGAQARLGRTEEQASLAITRLEAEKTSFGIVRNEMVSADPFETATRLEALQLQLETHYTLTARLSRLSLTEYLR